jgi:hypothetical protein
MTPSHSFVVICEGSGDQKIAAAIATRVLSDLADWTSSTSFRFRGLDDNEDFSSWAGLKSRAGEVPRRSGFKEGATLDGAATWRALHLAQRANPDGVILVRDADNQSGRLASIIDGVRAARTSGVTQPVAVGVAVAKIEAWLLAAQSADGQTRAALRQELGFDPITQAELLRATDDPDAKLSAKRVLAALCGIQEAIEQLSEAPFDKLLKDGRNTGLPEFMREIRCELGTTLATHIEDTDWCRCAER